MHSYRAVILHVVFGTKYREQVLAYSMKESIHKYITGIVKNKRCIMYAINSVRDHIHICFALAPGISYDDLIKDIKLGCSHYIRTNNLIPAFKGWQSGYGVFSCTGYNLHRLLVYIQNQEEHHKTVEFIDEYRRLLKQHHIPFDEKYLFDD